MKKQIHESFKPFFVDVQDGKLSTESKKAISSFLKESHIHARSISALPFSDKVLICIGHDEKKMKKDMKYEVSIKKLGNFSADIANAELLITDLNKFSKKSQNVVCHSLLVLNDVVYAVLLTAKAE